MLDIQTILAPVDFSERSSVALAHAGALAELLEADLITAYFLPPLPSDYAVLYPNAADDAGRLPEIRKRLGEFASKMLGAFPVESIARIGDPARGVEELVKEKEVGLVVIATHGYGLFRRALLGSVASKLLHDLPIPILTGAHVPDIAPWDRRPYQRVVCAVGLDEHSRRTLEFARDLAITCGGRLDVVHAAPSLELSGVLGEASWVPPNLRAEIVARSTEEVAQLVRETGCDAKIHVDAANTVAFILSQVERLGADLLVVGRPPREGSTGRHHRLAQELISGADIPVLSV